MDLTRIERLQSILHSIINLSILRKATVNVILEVGQINPLLPDTKVLAPPLELLIWQMFSNPFNGSFGLLKVPICPSDSA